jgi:hypothetical protein
MKSRLRLVRLYYLATPLFLIINETLGANIRVAVFEDRPALKYGYYLLCTLLGAIMLLRPAWTAILGLAESSTNITLLVLGYLAPHFRAISELATSGQLPQQHLAGEWFLNFAISAAAWTISFYRNPLVKR